MRAYPLAPNEPERLEALRSLALSKTQADASLDALCRTAQELFNVPIALISLVEDDHQWFKAKCGLTVDQTPREVSFCSHAILQDSIFVISDAAADERFSSNPLVTGDPHTRFYAGAPISLAPGTNIGTLCIIDSATRNFSERDRDRLSELAQVVSSLLHLTKLRSQLGLENEARKVDQARLAANNMKLFELKTRLEHWTRLSSDWVWEADETQTITFSAGDLFATQSKAPVTGRPTRIEQLKCSSADEVAWKQFADLLSRQEPVRNMLLPMSIPHGKPIIAEVNADPVFDEKEIFIGYRGVTKDVTTREELVRRLRRAELIADETQHTIIITDANGAITWTNPGFTRLTGYTLEEVLGCSPGTILQCEDTDPDTVKEIRSALQNETGIRTTILNQTKDGRRYWLDIEIRPFFGSDGHLEGFIALENDVTSWVNENNRKAAVFENATTGIVIHDADGRTVDCNQEATRILGLTVDQLLGRNAVDPAWHLTDEHGLPLPADKTPAMRVLSSGEPVRNQTVGLRNGSGATRWLRANAQPFLVDAGDNQVLVSFADITEEELAQREVRTAREMLATIIETIPDAVAAYDEEDRLLLCNAAYRSFYSASAPAIKPGARFEDILRYGLKVGQYKDAGKSAASREAWLKTRLRRHNNPVPTPSLQHLDDGRWLQVRERRSPSGITVGVRTDITALKKAEEKVRLTAEQDSLTGLFNRRSFLRHVDNAVKGKRPGDGVGAIVMIDLDHFKDLNDTLGHDSGDLFLQEISRRLQVSVRPGDIVARLGGDEFALLLPGLAGHELARQVVERLMKAVTPGVRIAKKFVEPQMSIGVVSYPADGREVIELLKNADIAMYEAKKAGRNRIAVFSHTHKEIAARRSLVAERLREALRQHQLEVAFQAQVDIETGQNRGFEALARWNLNGEPISPGEFIAIAEEFDLGAELDLQIFRKSLHMFRQLKDKGLEPGKLAVNMGTRLLRDPQLLNTVTSLLEETNATPEELEIEVTEGVMIERGHETVKTNLMALRARGVTIALDDFGTGYASLTQLRSFSVDKIKIDRSFVSEVATNLGGDAIARTLVLLAGSLGIKIVAEGVETRAQRDALAAYGCTTGQGYYYHKPEVKLEALARYLHDTKRQQRL